ncbi:hypothetical protein KZ483_14130 [Paenibacillus sp. sptzw28]|uniref:hypothetical protein n=1 Tax=Paenibacillus sp. sptzw28 TaxID=715179 RepID=UPI001C6DF7BF|nr:hypothetical protein [Paenibacillus sp. sptzw28]QYR19113.1 hypothetical protein KZ483_14130 [Paenibacillus sp. sptzw28]
MRKTVLCFAVVFLFLTQLSFADDNEYHPVPKSPDTHPAFIDRIYTKNGHTYITADYIQWFEGEAANRMFREREKDADMNEAPDGYYIINDSKKLRTFEVDHNAVVLMQIYDRTGKAADDDIVWNERIDVAKFRSLFKKDGIWDMSDYPYHLTIENNRIVKIVQQYIP